MPIEIRELLIRATVAEPQANSEQLEALLARLKAQLLEECLSRIDARIGSANER
jgi:hypothetical protein